MIRPICGALLAALTLVSSYSSALAAPQSKAARKPSPSNLLLVTIDTLRADHIGAYGYKAASTPNLDRLAAEGTRFAAAYSAVPITLPSHATIMTGTFPMMHGLHDFSDNRLNQSQPTMAGILRGHGYATGAVVASAVLDSRFGLNSGFDFYYDHFDFSRLLETNLDAMERPANVVADEALKWLGQKRQKPFFLWVHLYDPHNPYHPPEPYATRFKSQPYDGEIAFADAQLGRVLAYLKAKGLYANTTIVVSGDHGEGLGEHQEKTHGFFIYDTTLHVPLIFKPVAAKPRVVETPVSLVDILPTVLDALHVEAPEGLQGHSLLPLLGDQEKESKSPLYGESFLPRIHFNWSEVRGVRVGNYHFIDGPKPELYDLESDPHELNNLFASRPALAAEMRGKLTGAIRDYTPGKELAEKTPLDPAMMERLKSLGYAAVSSGHTSTLSDPNLPDAKDRIGIYELISEAIDDSQHGRYDESIAKLNETLKTDPDSESVHYLLGLNYYRKHDPRSAVKEFERVLAASPDYGLAANYLGLSYAAAGELEQAVVTLQRALELDKTNHAAAFNLGVAYLQLKKIPESAAAFRRAVEIYPDYAQAHRALGELLLFQGGTKEAIESLRRATELAPEDARAWADLAQAYAAAGETEDAAAARKRADGLRPR